MNNQRVMGFMSRYNVHYLINISNIGNAVEIGDGK